jgi:hypothetical protein
MIHCLFKLVVGVGLAARTRDPAGDIDSFLPGDVLPCRNPVPTFQVYDGVRRGHARC